MHDTMLMKRRMKPFLRMAALFLVIFSPLIAQPDPVALHREAAVVDAHNDLLLRAMSGKDISKRSSSGHTDFARLKEGGVDVQVLAVFMGPEYADGRAYARGNAIIDSLEAVVLRNSSSVMITRNGAEVKKALAEKKLAVIIDLEGGYPIENSIEKLMNFYNRGARIMTLTWESVPWATASGDEALRGDSLKHKGLTELGREIVRKMNEIGMIIDLSHSGEQTFNDVMSMTTKPVLVSHSCASTIAPHHRNLKDDQIRRVAENGGVICINFYSGYIDASYDGRWDSIRAANKPLVDSIQKKYSVSRLSRRIIDSLLAPEYRKIKPTVKNLADHIDYAVKVGGIDHVGIGSDYDGVGSVPIGLDDVTMLPNLTKELVSRGYSAEAIKKIMGGNFLRIFK